MISHYFANKWTIDLILNLWDVQQKVTAFLNHHCFTNLASAGLKRLKCFKFIYTLQFPWGTVFHKLMRRWCKASLLFLAGILRHIACCSALSLSSPVQIINIGKYIIPLDVGAKWQSCQGWNKAISSLELIQVLYHMCPHLWDTLALDFIMSICLFWAHGQSLEI